MTPVQASISEVARAFVRPNSYTVDVDRLLLGREASMRTASVGVLQIIIHSAEGLPKMDAVGEQDLHLIRYSMTRPLIAQVHAIHTYHCRSPSTTSQVRNT